MHEQVLESVMVLRRICAGISGFTPLSLPPQFPAILIVQTQILRSLVHYLYCINILVMTLNYDLQDPTILGNRLEVHKLSLYSFLQLHVNLQVSQNKKQQQSLI